MTTFETETLMKDAEEVLREIDGEVTDQGPLSIVTLEDDYGVDLSQAATLFVTNYNSTNTFLMDLKRQLVLRGQLSPKQTRAALNVWKRSLAEKLPEESIRKEAQQCFTCKEWFESMQALLDHKDKKHNKKYSFTHHPDCTDNRHEIGVTCPLPPSVVEESVLESNDNRLGLDLSTLPDGRYAIPDVTGKQAWIFLWVSRQHVTKWRDRRYVWGKVQTGGEFIEAGTIEVRYHHGDSKELVGYQKPGQPYEGKFQVELEAVKIAPEPWALLFAREIGRCALCGKTLTDDISRNDGYGPECIDKINNGYWEKMEAWRNRFVNRDPQGHPYCEKHKVHHHQDRFCRD